MQSHTTTPFVELIVAARTPILCAAAMLLISPERLANDDFVNRRLLPTANRVGLFVVDEAHCISDSGLRFPA